MGRSAGCRRPRQSRSTWRTARSPSTGPPLGSHCPWTIHPLLPRAARPTAHLGRLCLPRAARGARRTLPLPSLRKPRPQCRLPSSCSPRRRSRLLLRSCRGAWRSRPRALLRRRLRRLVTVCGWSVDSPRGARGSTNGTTASLSIGRARSGAGAPRCRARRSRRRARPLALSCPACACTAAAAPPEARRTAPDRPGPQRWRLPGQRHFAGTSRLDAARAPLRARAASAGWTCRPRGRWVRALAPRCRVAVMLQLQRALLRILG